MSHLGVHKALRCFAAVLLGLILSSPAWSESHGRVTRIDFLGATSVPHPDTVRIQIERGSSQGGCDATFAVIRKRGNHLISFAPAAYLYLMGKALILLLDESDRYFGNRSVISGLYPDQQVY